MSHQTGTGSNRTVTTITGWRAERGHSGRIHHQWAFGVIIEHMVQPIPQILSKLVYIPVFAINFNSTPGPISKTLYGFLRKLPFPLILWEVLYDLLQPVTVTFHRVVCTLILVTCLPHPNAWGICEGSAIVQEPGQTARLMEEASGSGLEQLLD